MTTTLNLGITEVSANQVQKEVTINNALEFLDKVLTENLDVDCAAGGTIALSTAQAQQYMRYHLTGAPAATFNFQFPAGVKRFCIVKNNSGKTATVRQTATPTASVSLPDGGMIMFYVDGTASIETVAAGATTLAALTDGPGAMAGNGLKVLRVNSGGTAVEYGPKSTITVGAFQETAPTASAKVLRYIFTEAATFPANFSGSKGHIGTAATATTVLDVQKNGVSIGSISISTGSVFTFTTTSGTTKAFAVGDRLDIVAPGSPDVTAALIAVTLLANKD
jgi:hypothetical protein